MSRRIIIRPIGIVSESIIECITNCISNRLDFICKVFSKNKNPDYAYNEGRCQYNSKLILKNLIQNCSNDTFRLIGVTSVDLYAPILKYVFGLAQINGQCSLVSTHRLDPRFYNQPPNQYLLLKRVEKTTLHEIGHTFGLTHCRDKNCVMFSSAKIEDTDFKQPAFCLTCFELLNWNVEKL